MAHFREFAFKQFGYFDFSPAQPFQVPQHQNFEGAVKIAYVKADGKAVIDFKEYQLEHDALFFISDGQYFEFGESSGTMIYYNRDFYCVAIHDKEVSCDGILFHNVYEIPMVYLNEVQSLAVQDIITQLKDEFEQDDTTMEEMLRILLKTIIIKATRLWKHEHHITNDDARQEVEFSRKFSQLVDWHYTRHHTVAEYADLLNMTPKALNKRITRNSTTTPNDIIKNRIILEAKRLLAHTNLSVKEIGYKLGYDDPSYFIRLFTNQTSASPQNFRQQYQQPV